MEAAEIQLPKSTPKSTMALTHANLDLILAQIILGVVRARYMRMLRSHAKRATTLGDNLGDMLDLIQTRALRRQGARNLVHGRRGRKTPPTRQLALRSWYRDIIAHDEQADRVLAEVGGSPPLLGQAELKNVAGVILDDDEGAFGKGELSESFLDLLSVG